MCSTPWFCIDTNIYKIEYIIQFQIIDIYGRIVKEIKINDNKTRISINNLKSGFYIARMRIKNKIKEQKLIINKS